MSSNAQRSTRNSVLQSMSSSAPLSTSSSVRLSTSRWVLTHLDLDSRSFPQDPILKISVFFSGLQHRARAEVWNSIHGEVRRAMLNSQWTSAFLPFAGFHSVHSFQKQFEPKLALLGLQHGQWGSLQHCERAGKPRSRPSSLLTFSYVRFATPSTSKFATQSRNSNVELSRIRWTSR